MKWIQKNRRIMLLNIILFIFLGSLIAYYISQQSTPKADVIATIVNQASVKWCTEGESTTTCNPSSNIYSGSATSNSVSTTVNSLPPSPSPSLSPAISPSPSPSPSPVATLSLCLKALSTASSDPIISSVMLESQKSDGTPITKLASVAVTNGIIQLTDQAFLTAANATAGNKIVIKADKHIALGTASSGAIKTGTCSTYTTLTLKHGDFDNNNKIDLADISQLIAIRRNGTKSYPYPNGVSLAHIGQIISYRVSSPNGDKITL